MRLFKKNRKRPDEPEPLYIALSTPKTGTSTLNANLSLLKNNSIAAHYLCDANLGNLEENAEESDEVRKLYNRYIEFNSLIKKQRAVYLDKGTSMPSSQRPRILTSVREPIDWYLSCFFWVRRNSEDWHIDNLSKIYDELYQEMVGGELYWGVVWYEYPGDWIEKELEGFFKLKILSSDFDKKKGWDSYQSEFAKAVVVRQESFKTALDDALFALTGQEKHKEDESISANLASSRKGWECYNALRESLKLNEEFLNQIYSTKWVRTFYTNAELEAFKQKWCT